MVKSDEWFNSTVTKVNWGNGGLFLMAYNGWWYVFGLPCMAYRVTTTAIGKLKYTACYVLGGLSAFNLKTMNKYEIHIGEIFDLTTNSKKPKQTLIITQEQLAVIEQFADQRKDVELNTIYKLNECEFRILPHFDFGAVK